MNPDGGRGDSFDELPQLLDVDLDGAVRRHDDVDRADDRRLDRGHHDTVRSAGAVTDAPSAPA